MLSVLVVITSVIFSNIGNGFACDIIDLWPDEVNKTKNVDVDRAVLDEAEIYYIYEYGTKVNTTIGLDSLFGGIAAENNEIIKLIYNKKTQRVTIASPINQITYPTDKIKIKIHKYDVAKGSSYYLFTLKYNGDIRLFLLNSCKIVKVRETIKAFPITALWVENYTVAYPMRYIPLFQENFDITRFNNTGFKNSDAAICDQFVHYFNGCPLDFHFVFMIGIGIGFLTVGSFFLIVFIFTVRKNLNKMRIVP